MARRMRRDLLYPQLLGKTCNEKPAPMLSRMETVHGFAKRCAVQVQASCRYISPRETSRMAAVYASKQSRPANHCIRVAASLPGPQSSICCQGPDAIESRRNSHSIALEGVCNVSRSQALAPQHSCCQGSSRRMEKLLSFQVARMELVLFGLCDLHSTSVPRVLGTQGCGRGAHRDHDALGR